MNKSPCWVITVVVADAGSKERPDTKSELSYEAAPYTEAQKGMSNLGGSTWKRLMRLVVDKLNRCGAEHVKRIPDPDS